MKSKGVLALIVILIALVLLSIFLYRGFRSDIGVSDIGLDGLSEDTKFPETELSEEQEKWKPIMDAAFQPRDCPEPPARDSGALYYSGPLIDTHIHIAPIPDDVNAVFDEDEVSPLMGLNVNMADYVCMIDYENTAKVFAFFPVWEPVPQFLEVVSRTLAKYPGRFVPFIMPPDHDDRADGFPTVDSDTLKEMLSIYPGMFDGYGEIGLYERGDHGGPKGAPALFPDSERLREIYPVVRENNLIVYFHLGEGQKESYEKILEENPDITFIFHGDQLIPYDNGEQNLQNIDDILNNHENAYYGVDELYGGVWLIKPEVSKEEFLAHFEDYRPLLEEDIAVWKDFIERHQNQVLWGTDRGWSSPWSLDTEVAITLNNYSRTFIGHLAPEVQEKFAYKNAERILG